MQYFDPSKLSDKDTEYFLFLSLGTSTIASSEENDLDREAAGDSGFSDGN